MKTLECVIMSSAKNFIPHNHLHFYFIAIIDKYDYGI